MCRGSQPRKQNAQNAKHVIVICLVAKPQPGAKNSHNLRNRRGTRGSPSLGNLLGGQSQALVHQSLGAISMLTVVGWQQTERLSNAFRPKSPHSSRKHSSNAVHGFDSEARHTAVSTLYQAVTHHLAQRSLPKQPKVAPGNTRVPRCPSASVTCGRHMQEESLA